MESFNDKISTNCFSFKDFHNVNYVSMTYVEQIRHPISIYNIYLIYLQQVCSMAEKGEKNKNPPFPCQSWMAFNQYNSFSEIRAVGVQFLIILYLCDTTNLIRLSMKIRFIRNKTDTRTVALTLVILHFFG